jgi:two-component system sensor histidine kinase YesM
MNFRFKLALQKKLFILFSAIIVFPLVFCSVLLYKQSVDIIEKNTGAMQSARLDYFADRFNLIIEKFYQDLLNLAVNKTIQEIIMTPLDVAGDNIQQQRGYLASSTRNVLFTDNMIQSIIVYSRLNDWLFVNSNAASNMYFGNVSVLRWVESAANREHGVFMTVSSSVSPLLKVDGEKVISLFVSLRNANQQPLGYISINLDIRGVQGQLTQILQSNNLQSTVVIDRDENIVSTYGPHITPETLHTISAKITENNHSGYFIDTISKEQYLISYSVIPRYDWKIIVSTPIKQIGYQNRMITNIVFIISAVFIILSLGIAYILSINLLKPLTILFEAMRQIKDGKLSYAIPYTRTDEIGLLYDGFNEMSKNLDTLMEKLYQDELAKKDLQLKMMGYQINAHFLYNTLDVIHWIAQINKVPQITSLVSSLVSYFRITLSEGHDLISIEKVVKLAEDYINIYAIKSEYIVDFIVDIDASFYEYKTLKYIFQPLLENALNHGIEEKAENGIIFFSCERITSTQKGVANDLLFTISDSGAGMPPEKLQYLQSMLENNNLNEVGNFALRNINTQIKIYYGNQYGIKIESTPGKGTAVYVRVPVIREDHHV